MKILHQIDQHKLKFYRENYPDCFDKAVEELEKQYNNDLRNFIDNLN